MADSSKAPDIGSRIVDWTGDHFGMPGLIGLTLLGAARQKKAEIILPMRLLVLIALDIYFLIV